MTYTDRIKERYSTLGNWKPMFWLGVLLLPVIVAAGVLFLALGLFVVACYTLYEVFFGEKKLPPQWDSDKHTTFMKWLEGDHTADEIRLYYRSMTRDA